MDLKDAYITYKNEYIESVWWILKNFWERICYIRVIKLFLIARAAELRYRIMKWRKDIDEASDPSVFVRMPLVDEPGTSLLVWTTTPWTLPANVAVAAGADVDYVTVEPSITRRWY